MSKIKEWNLYPEALTGVSLVMLEEMIIRKEKWEQYKKAKNHWSLFTLLCLGFFLFFGAQALQTNHVSFSGNFLSLLVGNVIVVLLIGLFSLGLMQIKFLSKKTNKAEDEYEALRIECIERQTELWERDSDYKVRENVFSYMKKSHDVNLYYK
ncbi:DUF2663 family protein [Bacillus sp. FJAT-45037]|uniref:DUF2663 family protein n=1 Tax=Bacillus sp. FJAT-45037 TaxID=2011007 RepID=UPI000C239A43|nr:DUF2663 family protein [Bacillus sp. FJAT-45037]